MRRFGINQFWHNQICKHQYIASTLMLTIVFGIRFNFLIVLSIWVEICRSNEFCFFVKQNVHARKIGRALEVLRDRSAPDAQFVQAWYCSYTLHILFHSETKITLFYLHLFSFIHFHLCYHSLSFFIIHFIIIIYFIIIIIIIIIYSHNGSFYHSFSFVESLVVIRCHSLSLVVFHCTTRYHSLSLVVTRCTIRCHSLSLDVPLACLFINDRCFLCFFQQFYDEMSLGFCLNKELRFFLEILF